MLVTSESLVKLSNCFTSADETAEFLNKLSEVVEELLFQGQLAKRVSEKELMPIVLKQICVLTLFIRENIELIQQLVVSLDCRQVDEEEFNETVDDE